MRTFLLGLILLVWVSSAATASEPLQRLVRQLGSPRYQEREQAAAALRAEGAAALPLLHKALDNPDAEVRRRAERLLTELTPLVDGQKILQPQKIKLSYRDEPVLQALEDFARKSRLPLLLDRNERSRLSKRRLTLQTEELSCWEAYERLLAAAGLNEHAGAVPRWVSTTSLLFGESRSGFGPSSSRGGRSSFPYTRGGPPSSFSSSSLLLLEGRQVHYPTSYAGALRIRAMEPTEARTPQGDAPVTLICYLEPRIRWQQIDYVRVDHAVDVFGRSLNSRGGYVRPPQASEESSSEEVTRSSRSRTLAARQATLWLHAPDARARVAEHIRGVIGAWVESDNEALVQIENVATAADRTVKGADGTTLKVANFEVDGERKRVRLRLEIHRPQGFPEIRTSSSGRPGRSTGRTFSTRAELEQHGLALLDRKGDGLFVARGQWEASEDGNTRTYTVEFEPILDQGTEPMKLLLSGRRVALIEVPFTLRNVPLP